MNLSKFMKQVDQMISKCNKKQLEEFIHETARMLPEEKREGFLDKLQVITGEAEAQLQEEGNISYDELAEALELIESEEKYLCQIINEEYDEWYDSEDDEFYYTDPEGIMDVVVKVCDFIHLCVDHEDYQDGMAMGERLFALEVQADGEYGEEVLSVADLVHYGLLDVNLRHIALDTLLCIYNATAGTVRAEKMYDIISDTEINDLSIENLMQHGDEELKGFEEFLEAWIAYLGEISGNLAERLFTEALSLQNDKDMEVASAKKYVSAHPGLFLKILEAGNRNHCADMLEIGLEGIRCIDKKYRMRSKVALKTAEYALCSGDKSIAQECYFTAFESDTNAVNYLRNLLNTTDQEGEKERMENLFRTFPEGSYYSRSISTELAQNLPSEHMLLILKFLNGDFMEVVNKALNKKEALGWSGTFMKKGIAIYLLYLYEGENPGQGIRQMLKDSKEAFGFTKEEYLKGLDSCFDGDDSLLFYECFHLWKQTVSMKAEEKECILKKFEKLLEKRVGGIMEANRRGYYLECAAFIAALGEVKESRGEKGGKQKLMKFYADSYPRRRAFKEELQRCGWVK